MTQMNQQKRRRRRGVILTLQGLEKLQQAKSKAEFQEKSGNRYTLEALSERTGLSMDTLMKLFGGEAGVDKQSLKCCFSAFKLVLEPSDYFWPPKIEESHVRDAKQVTKDVEPELPGGQVPLDSVFYVEREPLEAECYKTIVQPGALIRIKAPRRMGKTSLMARILHQAENQGYRTVPLSLQLADRGIFQDLDKFLHWFCANVSLGVELPNQLADYWDDIFGSKINCKLYFERYLLHATTQPLVLGLDDVDQLFQYPDLADDFFGLLRAWHEEAKNREIWKRLRLVVVHSTEVYIPLQMNQSPFNVGLPIELPEFTSEQVQGLALQHGLNWSDRQIEQLMALVGGHPYLLRVALYHLWRQDVTLEHLLQTFPTKAGIYSDHLQRQLWNLQQHPELAAAYGQVVMSRVPVELDFVQAFKLQSMGLVHLQGNQATPSCELYRQYFRDRFNCR